MGAYNVRTLLDLSYACLLFFQDRMKILETYTYDIKYVLGLVFV